MAAGKMRKLVAGRRRRFKKRYVRRFRKGRQMGYFRLVRRVPEQALLNGTTVGTIITVPPVMANGVVQYGTPIATGFAGYYNIGGQASFKLNDIINPQDITNLFDKYRIKWVKLNIYSTSTTASAASTAQLPSIIYNVDEDDGVIPTPSFMREKMGSKQKMFYPGKPVSIFLRPLKVATSLNLTSALTAIGNQVSVAPWINSTYDAVPHFGLKFALQDVNLQTTSYTQFKWDITYCIEGMDAQ